MTGSADSADLGPVVAALRDDPEFLAGRLGQAGNDVMAAHLDLEESRLQRLLLCKAPAPSRFLGDVQAIAEHVGTDPTAFAVTLREADALIGLRGAGQPIRLGTTEGMLAAARDDTDDHVTVSTDREVQLRELADEVWQACPEDVRHARDIDAAVAWSASLALVTLPRLTLSDVRDWLADHGVSAAGDDTTPLRGFLTAYRGVGIIAVDGKLDTVERRFTVAHEVGHFLLDYQLPRRRTRRDAPNLLEVVDGVREPTASDRAQAVLARVPLGPHTHQLARAGDSAPDTVQESAAGGAEDTASRFALELLSPWADALDLVRDAARREQPYRPTVVAATDRLAARFQLPSFAAHTRARQTLDALGIRPGFFDR